MGEENKEEILVDGIKDEIREGNGKEENREELRRQ